MFHRRLVLLAATFALISLALTAQMFRLSVVEGSERLAMAEAKLDRRTFLPTHRGFIYDRHNRVLAMDRASSNVAVRYSVITGDWVTQNAAQKARSEVGRSKWLSLSPAQRDELIKKHLPEFQARRQRLWDELCRLGSISPEELHQRLDAIKGKVQTTAALVWERQLAREQMLFGINADEFKQRPIREHQQAHVILRQVGDDLAFAFRRLELELPNMFEVQDGHSREYPWLNAEVTLSRIGLPRPISSDKPLQVRVSGVADHILGSMRHEIWDADVKRRPFRTSTGQIDLGGYDPEVTGDSVGARGIERAFEDHLRGWRGEIRERIDTGEQIRTDPKPGGNVRLTLDIALQARVQAILSPQFGLTRVQPWQKNTLPLGTPLNSAAVVIEVETGELLAMVSMPTLAMGEEMNDHQKLVNQPQVNRAAEAIYPPGSIIKPFVFAAAVMENLHRIDHSINCTGHYFPENKNAARCWIYRERFGFNTHGSLGAEQALARSCNIFFYTLGDRLGIERLVKWFSLFGMGEPLDAGLLVSEQREDGNTIQTGEAGGSLPSQEKMAAMRRTGQLKFTEVIMGIGQGPMTWTPMQAANAYAMLARGGSVRDATLLLTDPRGPRQPRCQDLKLHPRLVATALEGLRQSVMERYGTGHHISYDDQTEEPIINADAVQVWAKTGTAQAPPLRMRDTNGDGKITAADEGIRDLDHSWFVGLVGPRQSNQPLYAIAVIVEYGGSGGRTAGPVANQIIRALQSEGYLPGDPEAVPPGSKHTTVVYEPEPDGEDEE